jgi:hypothetical protein
MIHELVSGEHPSLVCLQETKNTIIADFDISQLLGADFDYAYLPASHTRGGILVTWHASVWLASNIATHQFSFSAKMRHAFEGSDL